MTVLGRCKRDGRDGGTRLQLGPHPICLPITSFRASIYLGFTRHGIQCVLGRLGNQNLNFVQVGTRSLVSFVRVCNLCTVGTNQ